MTKTPTPSPVFSRLRETVRSELDKPALRGSYALLVNTALTAALGFGFWVVAARMLPVEVFGAGTATVAVIMTVANLGQLNLYQSSGVLLADSKTNRRVVATRILVVATTATVIVGGLSIWVGSLTGWMADITVPAWAVVVAAVVWTWFALKDGILVGLRMFSTIPIANTVYGALKIVAIVVFAAMLPEASVPLATFVPALIVAPLVLFLAARRLQKVPASGTYTGIDARFIGVDYVGFVFLQLSTTLLPFLVLLGADARAAGVFAAIWMMIAMLDTVAHNAGVPLASEAARAPAEARATERAVRWRTLTLVGVAATVAVLAAWPVLHIFGSEYAEAGTLTFQLMAVASVPRAFVVISFAAMRAQRKVAPLAVLEIIHAALVLGGCVILLPQLGLVAVGIVWLVAQCALAGLCAVMRARTGVRNT